MVKIINLDEDPENADWLHQIRKRREAKMRFELGSIVQTRGVCVKRNEDAKFNSFVQRCLARHIKGDWGDLDEEDKKENEFSLGKRLRLFSVYKGSRKIWIITEADRSATTILFPDEY